MMGAIILLQLSHKLLLQDLFSFIIFALYGWPRSQFATHEAPDFGNNRRIILPELIKKAIQKTYNFASAIEPRHLWFAVLIAIVAKVLISIFFVHDFHSVEDWAIAKNLVDGLGYTYIPSVGPTALKMPVYPMFLSMAIMIFGDEKLFPVLLQHVLMSVTAIGIFKTSEFFFSRKVSLWLGVMFLLHPSFFFYSNTLEVTNLFVPAFVAAMYTYLYFLGRGHESRSVVLSILLGVLASLLLQLQPVVLPVVAACVLYLAASKRLKQALVISAVGMMLLAPWTVRNYSEFGKFMPLKSPVWMNFYLGYWQTGQKYVMVSDSLHREIFDNEVTKHNDIEMEARYKSIVYPIIMNDIPLYLEKSACQAYMYWTYPPRYIGDRSISFLVARKIPNFVLTLGLAVSLFIAYRRNRKFFWSAVLILSYFTAVYALTSVLNIRYKLDIEWLEIICIGFVLTAAARLESVIKR